MSEVGQDSIAKDFFEHSHQLVDEGGKPLTNIYWSHATGDMPAAGCVYLIHGYGGSPIEPCMKLPMMYGLGRGFDIVAIEGCALSATYGEKKEVGDMTLSRQKTAILQGLKFCAKEIPDLATHYNIGWAHSLSCRALSDLMVDSRFVREYFNEIILNNPYFMAPPKVVKMKQRLLKSDPTGGQWETLARRVAFMSRCIESRTYTIPTRLYNLAIPLPDKWRFNEQNFVALAKKMSHFVSRLRMYFVLGTADNMADYNQNLEFFRGLRVPAKQLVCIDGANHSFENALEEYATKSQEILESIKANLPTRGK